MKPTKNRLIVQVYEDKKEKASFMTAKVLAVGPEVVDIKVNDDVIFAPYGFDEIEAGKVRKVIINDELILAINDKK